MQASRVLFQVAQEGQLLPTTKKGQGHHLRLPKRTATGSGGSRPSARPAAALPVTRPFQPPLRLAQSHLEIQELLRRGFLTQRFSVPPAPSLPGRNLTRAPGDREGPCFRVTRQVPQQAAEQLQIYISPTCTHAQGRRSRGGAPRTLHRALAKA